jgi:hypothetical protein
MNIYCDNKSDVEKIKQCQEFRRTVNQHRHPDVDLELQVMQELANLKTKGCKISINFVRSHQDKNKTIYDMTNKEYLNTLADKLTHKARSLPCQKYYYPFSANPVNLIINNRYHNSNYLRVVKSVLHSLALSDYYLDKCGWKNSTIDLIWWQVYHKCLVKLSESEKLVIRKFINNRLPTRKRENTYNKYPSVMCPTRKLHMETEDHILQCRTPAHQHIRNEWQKELQEYLSKSHTPTNLKYYFCHGLFSWIEMGRFQPHSPPPIHYDRSLHKAVSTQELIGWQHLARGRMTIEWGHSINQHLANQDKYKINAEQWGAKILSINWKYILQIWQQRNTEVHGTTSVDNP